MIGLHDDEVVVGVNFKRRSDYIRPSFFFFMCPVKDRQTVALA